MTLRTRLFALVGSAIALTVVLVTWTVSVSARRSFAAVDAQRAAAFVAQFQREFKNEGAQVAMRLERIAASETMMRTVADVSRANADYASYVNEASALGNKAPYALRTAARALIRLFRICWSSGLLRRASSMA